MKDLAFIVSTGRTGTAFFGEHLSRVVDGAYSTHEPDVNYGWDRRTLQSIRTFGVYHMVVGRALGRTGARILAKQYRTGRLSHAEAVERVRRSRARFHESIAVSLVIEANCQWALLLPVLRDAYASARIAVMTRDRDAWVHSCIRKGGRYDAADPVGPSGRGRLSPVELGDPELGPRWESMSVAEKLAWEWTYTTGKLTEFAAADPLCRLYAYEDLFLSEHREAALGRMLDFITDHGERRYAYRFDPGLLGRRVNAS
jgi:hypothetical protein